MRTRQYRLFPGQVYQCRWSVHQRKTGPLNASRFGRSPVPHTSGDFENESDCHSDHAPDSPRSPNHRALPSAWVLPKSG